MIPELPEQPNYSAAELPYSMIVFAVVYEGKPEFPKELKAFWPKLKQDFTDLVKDQEQVFYRDSAAILKINREQISELTECVELFAFIWEWREKDIGTQRYNETRTRVEKVLGWYYGFTWETSASFRKDIPTWRHDCELLQNGQALNEKRFENIRAVWERKEERTQEYYTTIQNLAADTMEEEIPAGFSVYDAGDLIRRYIDRIQTITQSKQ